MDTSVNRDFNTVAKVLLVFSFIATAISVITRLTYFDTYSFFGYNVETLYVEVIINALILVAIIFTFLKKPFGLIALTLLFIIRMFATINWSGHPSISTQLGGKFGFFIRDFGLFAIAMCFKKNGISGWKSMLASKETLAEYAIEDETADEISNEPENDGSAISNNATEDATHIDVEVTPVIPEDSQIRYEKAPEIDTLSKEDSKERQEMSTPVNHPRHLSKRVRISILFLGGLITVLLIMMGIVALKSYPEYITSFGDKWKYTFNLSNDQLGKKLLDRVYSLRKNRRIAQIAG